MIIVTHTVFFSLQFLNNLSHEMMQYSRNSFDFEDRFNIEIPKLGGTKESPLLYQDSPEDSLMPYPPEKIPCHKF